MEQPLQTVDSSILDIVYPLPALQKHLARVSLNYDPYTFDQKPSQKNQYPEASALIFLCKSIKQFNATNNMNNEQNQKLLGQQINSLFAFQSNGYAQALETPPGNLHAKTLYTYQNTRERNFLSSTTVRDRAQGLLSFLAKDKNASIEFARQHIKNELRKTYMLENLISSSVDWVLRIGKCKNVTSSSCRPHEYACMLPLQSFNSTPQPIMPYSDAKKHNCNGYLTLFEKSTKTDLITQKTEPSIRIKQTLLEISHLSANISDEHDFLFLSSDRSSLKAFRNPKYKTVFKKTDQKILDFFKHQDNSITICTYHANTKAIAYYQITKGYVSKRLFRLSELENPFSINQCQCFSCTLPTGDHCLFQIIKNKPELIKQKTSHVKPKKRYYSLRFPEWKDERQDFIAEFIKSPIPTKPITVFGNYSALFYEYSQDQIAPILLLLTHEQENKVITL